MHKERLSPWKAAAGAAVFLLAEACGSNVPTTPNPTRTPEATPSPVPSLVVTPTPEVTPSPFITPSPSPEITPSPTPEITPTPEATPIPIDALINQIIADAEQNGWPTVSKQDVTDSINNAYENDPEAAAIINPENNTLESEVVNNIWNTCSRDPDPAVKRQVCAVLFGHAYWKGFSIDENSIWIQDPQGGNNATLPNIVYFTHEILNSQDFETFTSIASDLENPF
ncbi:MAG: hypothetical protein A2798_03380 [Candidatus Levybacteria bacterium RIFCSPHIGHO2_01_FULL_37_17]|nr:MAG: hypothetical protein A2798_03380 [Candidatus Levybacteria bacterium RIFCSPHIGHO2_01_FULL_37_17]OGH36895.1 MAG: hypothetical protein A2959_01370 [Candidatus Levybacteria bacterium RIFCSPLOWO2_01_FULL_38_23]